MSKNAELLVFAVLCVAGVSLAPSVWSLPFFLWALVLNVRHILRSCYVKVGPWEFGRMDLRHIVP